MNLIEHCQSEMYPEMHSTVLTEHLSKYIILTNRNTLFSGARYTSVTRPVSLSAVHLYYVSHGNCQCFTDYVLHDYAGMLITVQN
jgi:hypothetical protein